MSIQDLPHSQLPPLSGSSPLPEPSPPTVPRTRPFGLRAIIFLLILQAIGYLVVCAIAVWATVADTNTVAIDPIFVVENSYTLIAYFLLAPLNLISGVGLWRLKRWAWVLTMVILAYSMIQDIVSHFGGDPVYFSMALNVIKVGYLNQREVQLLFGDPLT